MVQAPFFPNYIAIIRAVAWIVPLGLFIQMLITFNRKRPGGNFLAATLLVNGLLLAEVLGDRGTVIWLVSGRYVSSVTSLVVDFVVFGVFSVIAIENGSRFVMTEIKPFNKIEFDPHNMLTGLMFWAAGTTGLAEVLSLAVIGDGTSDTLMRVLSLFCLGATALLVPLIISVLVSVTVPWVGEYVIAFVKKRKAARDRKIVDKSIEIVTRNLSAPADIQSDRAQDQPKDREV